MGFVLYGYICPDELRVATFADTEDRDRARQVLLRFNRDSDALGPDALLIRLADCELLSGIPRNTDTLFDWHLANPGVIERKQADEAQIAAAFR